MELSAARRILVLAPHPDDEVVACGISTGRARAAGARVFVLYLTTGLPEAALLWPRHRRGYAARVARRRAEALSAAALLGLEPVAFRNTPSRRLCGELDQAADELALAIDNCGAEALWVPAFEGGHQDHDAANVLAATLASRLPVWEFAAYNFAGGRVRANRFADERGNEEAYLATPAEAELKRRALACYASERGNLGHLGADLESCRKLPRYDYASPPHSGRLFRERFHWVPFRHPRVDFTPSVEVYDALGRWVSTRQPQHDTVFGDGPGGEPREPDGKFPRPLDEAQCQSCLGGQPG